MNVFSHLSSNQFILDLGGNQMMNKFNKN